MKYVCSFNSGSSSNGEVSNIDAYVYNKNIRSYKTTEGDVEDIGKLNIFINRSSFDTKDLLVILESSTNLSHSTSKYKFSSTKNETSTDKITPNVVVANCFNDYAIETLQELRSNPPLVDMFAMVFNNTSGQSEMTTYIPRPNEEMIIRNLNHMQFLGIPEMVICTQVYYQPIVKAFTSIQHLIRTTQGHIL